MKIFKTIELIPKENMEETSIALAFKDFLKNESSQKLDIKEILETFNGSSEVYILSGTGDNFYSAIESIKNCAIGYNPYTAKKLIMFMALKDGKISKVIRAINQFKDGLEYTETFKCGFSINSSQTANYVIYIACADLVDEDELVTLDIFVADRKLHVTVKRRDVKKTLNAAKVITEKYNCYRSQHPSEVSQIDNYLMVMMDLALQLPIVNEDSKI